MSEKINADEIPTSSDTIDPALSAAFAATLSDVRK